MGPKTFHTGDKVPLYVNRVFSEHVPLPFAYYDLSFVCRPETFDRPWLNIGEVLRGDRIASSEYNLYMGTDKQCQRLCTRELGKTEVKDAKELVQQEYLVEWIADKLPGATVFGRRDKVGGATNKEYQTGFALGTFDQGEAYLNNHVDMNILYESVDNAGRRIVGFEVYPRSIKSNNLGCDSIEKLQLDDGLRKVTYTYSVKWIEDNTVSWSHRWDRYLVAQQAQVHWYAIFNSAVITVLLTCVVAAILMRMLNRDITASTGRSDEEMRDDLEETSGWKLLHGDVFRAPALGGLLAPLLGTTVQVLYTVVATVALGTLGILSPSYRGGLLTTGIALFLMFGGVCGYYSGHLYRTWGGTNWMRNAVMSAALVPGALMGVELLLNLFLWWRASSAAMPFSTVLLLFVLWLFVQLPLTLLGGWFGFRRQPYSEPARTNAIPRPTPPQPAYLRSLPSVLLAGALPFSVVFIELFFVLKALWQGSFYYEYGFAVLVGLLLSLAVCETTIIMVWLSLNAGHHRWWWRAFVYGASSSVYFFAYSVFFYVTRLRGGMPESAGFVPALTFFTHSLLISAAYALCTGSMGFFAAYFFVRRIYGMVKLS
ncbi:hypothetical protein GGI07_001832 [Coemansia sp. Benny D115]|nr:hypothetical protein GGI07_001832 [Coemansia sp. Benny D115]